MWSSLHTWRGTCCTVGNLVVKWCTLGCFCSEVGHPSWWFNHHQRLAWVPLYQPPSRSSFLRHQEIIDSVPHNQLHQSLADIGVSGKLHQSFGNYLSGRHQGVVLDGFSSTYKPVTSGVPQGSILGPLLYIIFMNSISHIPLSEGAKIVLYADDILLYKPINSAGDTSNLQEDVDAILKWIREHGLTPNHTKTKLLTISRSRRPISTNLKIEGHIIPPQSIRQVPWSHPVVKPDLVRAHHQHQ